jgi:hypothetical protein
MSEGTPPPRVEEPLLDQILREAVPEIKLAMGDLIDRDNARAIPDRYARLLPETVLVVTLRPDAAAAVAPVAAELEGELTTSCMRHGSLYDRPYRVRLRQAGDPAAPLFRISKESADAPEDTGPALGTMSAPPRISPVVPAAEPRSATPLPPLAEGTIAVPRPPAEPTVAAPRPAARTESPRVFVDPDATRMEGMAPPDAAPAVEGWDEGAWELLVEDEEGGGSERFAITAPQMTVGRQTDNAELRSDIMLSGAQQVSRRHLVLRWAPRENAPGFLVANLGLNSLHFSDGEVAGANVKGPLQMDALPERHTRWLGIETPVRVGEHGPLLRIRPRSAPAEAPHDPDATRYG